MIGFAAILFTAAVGVTLARCFRLPAIPFVILCGWILAVFGPALSEDVRANALELGLAFLVFASGAELNPRRLGERFRSMVAVVLVQLLGTAVLISLAARWFEYSWPVAITLGLAFATSSTVVATRQLRRNAQTQEPFARFASRALLTQDFFIVLFVVVLASWQGGAAGVLLASGKALLLVVPALACQHFLMPRLVLRKRFAEETLLLFLLAALFLFIGAAAALDLPLVVGAFFGGMIFSRFPANGVVRGQMASLNDFFLGLFFATLPQLVGLPSAGVLWQALVFAALVLVMRPLILYCLCRRYGLDGRASVETGLLLAQVSEYAVVVGLVAFHAGILGSETLALVALTTALTMTVTPFVANDRTAGRLLHRIPLRGEVGRERGAATKHRGHVLMVGHGAGGKWVLKPLLDRGVNVLVIDDDPAVAKILAAQGVPCIVGDGGDPRVLDAAGAAEAAVVLASPRRVADALKLLSHLAGPPVMVRVFEASDAEAVKRAGGIPVMNSAAGADAFLEWFEKRFGGGEGEGGGG